MNELLDIVNVTKVFPGGLFGEPVRAIDDVNLSLPERPSILSLVGESGSGKSTLARAILGLLQPDSGRIELQGRDVNSYRGRRGRLELMRMIQPVFQNPYDSFNPVRPVSDALFETALNLTMASDRQEAAKVIQRSLEVVGLDLAGIAGKYHGSFSGGQLQRLSIARALIPNPRLIVADEPVSALDASLRMTVVNLFAQLKETLGVSFIYVTHDLSTAYYISDMVAIMKNGRIVEYGESDTVLTSPSHDYTKTLLDSIPRIGERWNDTGEAVRP